jgi:hypothetical protein
MGGENSASNGSEVKSGKSKLKWCVVVLQTLEHNNHSSFKLGQLFFFFFPLLFEVLGLLFLS